MKRKISLPILVVSTVLLLMANPLFADSYRDKPTGLTFPETIGDMQLDKITDFEKDHPGLGLGIGYHHRALNIYADVYVYNLKMKDIPDGSDNRAVNQQWKQSESDIATQTQKGVYQNLVLIKERSQLLGSSPGAPTALLTEYTYSQKDIPKVSYLYITGYKKNFVKIRFTYPTVAKTEGEKSLEAFLDEMGKLLK